MKIVKSEGCTTYYTRIDDKDLQDMTREEKEIVLDRLMRHIKTMDMDHVINHILDFMDGGDFESHDCDQCNDTVIRMTFNL